MRAPRAGFWRIGRAPDPLALADPLTPDELDDPHVGNRFDSPLGTFRTLYFATDLRGCFGEILARFRPDLQLAGLVADWGEQGRMPQGELPASWRNNRAAVRVTSPPESYFLDVDALETREELRLLLARMLQSFGVRDLDLATIRGGDRRITRAIAEVIHAVPGPGPSSAYAGIRYTSRMDDGWECWAVFDRVPLTIEESRPILETDADLRAIARVYRLRVF